MNYNKNCFLIFLLLISNNLFSQSFEKKNNVNLLNNINLKSNENNAYINNNANIIFFNSSYNKDNKGGLEDKNDVWYSINLDGIWQKPNNLLVVNTIGNDLLLGITNNKIVVFSDGIIKYYNTDVNNIKELNRSQIKNFRSFYNLLSGSINHNDDLILFSMESFGSFGVEDIYISNRIDLMNWSQPKNIGSIINSVYQEISPFILNNDTLLFSSNRPSELESFNFYYSVKNDGKWSEPKLFNNLNSNAAEKFISFNHFNNTFLLSKEFSSVGNSNINLIKILDIDNLKELIINFNTNSVIDGSYEVFKDSILINKSDLNTPSIVYNFEKNDQLLFKFKINNFLQLDTLLCYNESESAYLSLKEIVIGSRLILNTIIFKRSSYELSEASLSSLNDLLHIFNNKKEFSVLIEGHTDNSGNFKENVKLSKKRADVIRSFLIDNGINKNRLKIKGYGPLKPRYSNSSEDTRKLNRRVEVLLIDN